MQKVDANVCCATFLVNLYFICVFVANERNTVNIEQSVHSMEWVHRYNCEWTSCKFHLHTDFTLRFDIFESESYISEKSRGKPQILYSQNANTLALTHNIRHSRDRKIQIYQSVFVAKRIFISYHEKNDQNLIFEKRRGGWRTT